MRRAALAVAVSIALHEIIAAMIPPLAPQEPALREEVRHVTLARIEPKPTPSPTPRPTAKPRAIAPVRAPVPSRVAVVPNHASGTSSHKEVIHHAGAARPKPPRVSHAKPIWDLPVGAQGAGARKGSGAGSLGSGGSGSGAGTSGSGSGSGGGACGYVTFQSVGSKPPRYDSASGFWVYDQIRMTVHYANGTTQDTILDYPWRFKDESVDPFLAKNSDVPLFFQFPPKSMRASEPPLVQYVMHHSTIFGSTTLDDCPSSTPSPGA